MKDYRPTWYNFRSHSAFANSYDLRVSADCLITTLKLRLSGVQIAWRERRCWYKIHCYASTDDNFDRNCHPSRVVFDTPSLLEGILIYPFVWYFQGHFYLIGVYGQKTQNWNERIVLIDYLSYYIPYSSLFSKLCGLSCPATQEVDTSKMSANVFPVFAKAMTCNLQRTAKRNAWRPCEVCSDWWSFCQAASKSQNNEEGKVSRIFWRRASSIDESVWRLRPTNCSLYPSIKVIILCLDQQFG